MKLNPKVSVIIPVYNTELYVHATVKSIQQQTLKELEIIIINDGSTDDSLKIIRDIAITDERIKIYNQKNQGLSVTRNIGLRHAIGKYIYFMDSDDLLENDALELCYKKCELEQLDFVFFDAECFSEDSTLSIGQFHYKRTQTLPNKICTGIEMMNIQLNQYQFKSSVCLNFINRVFLLEHHLEFFPGILHEDQLFTSQLYLQATRVNSIQRSFFYRRVRANSIMTRRFNWQNIHGYLTVTNELLKKINLFTPDSAATIHCFLAQMLNAAIWQAYVLPFRQRIRLYSLCITKYKRYVNNKTLGILLFKSYIHKSNN